MNLLADESVEQEMVKRLRTDGHTVGYVSEMSPSITDDEVLNAANSLGAILLTADKDFGELVYRLGKIHHGVVLARLSGMSGSSKADLVSDVFREHATELPGAFCVVAPGGIRIRHPSTGNSTTIP